MILYKNSILLNNIMECFQERKRFLRKYKDHLDFILLSSNKSVTSHLIKTTQDLPWNVDDELKQKSIPMEYEKTMKLSHTVADQNHWNYI